MLPNPDILNDYEHGKFVLSNLAAKRAKQLREGAIPLVRVDSNHPLTVALAEIAAGRIKAVLPEPGALTELDEMPTLLDEMDTAELGLLLPALDETEAALVSTVLDEDHEPDHEGDEIPEGGLSLGDLVEPEDVAPASSDEDTLSLSDIAEQETVDEEESEE